jgi:hypothetical protein
MTEPPEFTVTEKLAELEREIALRERVYPQWIQFGKMSASKARRQIDILRAIARDYGKKELFK